MIYFKLIITIYLYFIGFVAICYLSKKIVEAIENEYKRRNKHTKQHGNRK